MDALADIKLSADFGLTASATGDAPLVSGYDCVMQSIMLEAATRDGELFYDTDFGWSLTDFLNGEDDPLTILEIAARVRGKLERREPVLPDTISIDVRFENDGLYVLASFMFEGDGRTRAVSVAADAVTVEVTEID